MTDVVDQLEAYRDPVESAMTAAEASLSADVRAGRADDLAFEHLLEFEEITAPEKHSRWVGVAAVAAATVLVAVGVLVATRETDDQPVSSPNAAAPTVIGPVSTPAEGDPASSPSVADPPSSYQWSRVARTEEVFGGTGRQRMFSVTAGGPGLVAVGSDGKTAAVWTSVDGITWSRVPHDEAVLGGGGATLMFSVTAGGPGLVAVGSIFDERDELDESDAAVWTSVDGITWSRVPHDEAVFGGARMSGVTVGGPGLVAVGSDVGTDGVGVGIDQDSPPERDAVVLTSVDGITWSRVPHDEAIFGGVDNQEMMDVTVGGSGLVAVGTDGEGIIDNSGNQVAAVWTSVDGITWSRVPPEAVPGGGADLALWSVTAGGPGLVAVGWDRPHAMVWTSVDGVSWSRVPHDEEGFGPAIGWGMVSVTATDSGVVAVGDSVWTSVDGITWSRLPDDETNFPTSTGWGVIAAGPGLVAVGEVGSDAAAWVAEEVG